MSTAATTTCSTHMEHVPGENGLFLETAHPAKFSETIASVIGRRPQLPQRLQAFMDRKKQSIFMDNDFESFKCFLLNKG